MKKTYYSFPLIFLVALLFAVQGYSQKRVGYIQSWKSQVTADQASKLTHVIYSFVTIHPDLDGKLNTIDGNYLRTMVSITHQQGAKAILAVGGWFPCSYAYQGGACAADGNPEAFDAVSRGNARTNFVNNLYNMVMQYDLDGIDLDWEYPSAASQRLYVDLLSALRAKMNTHPSKRLELSAAVPASAYRGQHFTTAALRYLDDVHIMAYDASPRINHATYTFAANAINYWQGRGVASSKLQLGLPFYGWNSSGSSKAYKDIVAADASAPNKVYPNNNTCDQSNGYGYNAKKLIRDKVQLALSEKIGGIMIWAIDQDHANPSISLLNTIDTELNGGGSGGDGGGSGDSCTPWATGTSYAVGDIVTYNGSNYICVHANPGYNPVISTWFWDPTSRNCDSGGGGGACAAWSSGTQYYRGNIVSYQGSNYICEYDNPGYNPVISTWFWDPTSASCRSSAKGTATEKNENFDAHIYPNPLQATILNINITSDESSSTHIEIVDLQGRVVRKAALGALKTRNTTFQLNVSDLRSGVYIINISTDHGKATKRLHVL
ncbi:T9SS type A sorting domain-containing protein [Aquimarina sp. U1-2]|uniref:glycosyl hydrolase family 18 protein n=1 Tax=Aquimarina sp. U1-2 TaxID=2823141 RepID=UPI001AEC85B4|nr:glycosyl hydrolase family 18 protein [Aquimarina sp. U1-2]MBP2832133.1 T9SS type A sorting domain-containing protein [Aquimarina sp. U1-2]